MKKLRKKKLDKSTFWIFSYFDKNLQKSQVTEVSLSRNFLKALKTQKSPQFFIGITYYGNIMLKYSKLNK